MESCHDSVKKQWTTFSLKSKTFISDLNKTIKTTPMPGASLYSRSISQQLIRSGKPALYNEPIKRMKNSTK